LASKDGNMGWQSSGGKNIVGWAGSNGNPGSNTHGWQSETGSGTGSGSDGVAGAVTSAVSSAVDTAAQMAIAEGMRPSILL